LIIRLNAIKIIVINSYEKLLILYLGLKLRKIILEMSTSYVEDEIIKKRLLIEGDSGNDDRVINKLVRNFVIWSNHTEILSEHEETLRNCLIKTKEENTNEYYEQLIACLSHIEFSLLRNQFIYDMNKLEQGNYESLYQKINTEINRAKKKILDSKIELQEALKIRKNRQACDLLAKHILSYPNRLEMLLNIKNLEERLENFKKVDLEYERKLELRHKQFRVLLNSMNLMKNLIETDTKFDEYSSRETHLENIESIKNNQNENISNEEKKLSRLELHAEIENGKKIFTKREKYFKIPEVPDIEMEEF